MALQRMVNGYMDGMTGGWFGGYYRCMDGQIDEWADGWTNIDDRHILSPSV